MGVVAPGEKKKALSDTYKYETEVGAYYLSENGPAPKYKLVNTDIIIISGFKKIFLASD